MPYESRTIASYFLELANSEDKGLSPMKLIKLVYIAHGWHLGFTKRPLISDSISAWKYGPTIDGLYNRLRSFGTKRITEDIKDSDIILSEYQNVLMDEWLRGFLSGIWDSYKKYSAVELSTITHAQDTPWDTIWNKRNGKNIYGAIIPNDLIAAYYEEKTKRHEKG